MRFLGKLIKWIFILVILLVIGIIVFAYFFDLNKYKGQISDLVEKQTGRKFEIKGDARLGISLIPTLELEDVTFANAAWSKKPNMVTLERLDVQVSVLPLLKKEIEIYRVVLIKPEIYLEVNEKGKANWEFDKVKTASLGYKQYAQSSVVKSDAVVSNNKMPISGFMAKNVLVEDGLVSFSNAQSKQDVVLDIHELTLKAESIDSEINVTFDVKFNEEDIVGKARLGSLNGLFEAYNPYPIELNAKAYGVSAKVDGSVIDVLGGNPHYVLNVDVLNPRGNFGAPLVKFVGSVDGNVKAVKAEIQKLDVEGNVITGTVNADISGKVPSVNANLNSELFDLRTFMSKQVVGFKMPSLISSAYATEMVPATPIPYEFLAMANANLNAKIGSLIVNDDLKFDGVSLKAVLKDSVLNVSPLVLKTGKGEIDVNANVDGNAKTAALKIFTKDLVLQTLYTPLQPKGTGNFAFVSGGDTHLDVDVKTSGLTARSMAENLNGRAVAIVDKSQINMGELKLFSGSFIGQVLDMLKIKKSQKLETTLNCAVLRADVTNGKVNFPNGIAFDTDEFKLSSDGSVNLKDDKIVFSVKPFSGKVSEINITQVAASFLKVSGTLQKPTVGIDETQAAKAAIGMVAGAPIYAGAKLVSESSSAPCYTALDKTAYADMFPKPEGVATSGVDTVKDVSKAVTSTVKDIGSGLKETGKATTESLKNELDAAKNLFKSLKK